MPSLKISWGEALTGLVGLGGVTNECPADPHALWRGHSWIDPLRSNLTRRAHIIVRTHLLTGMRAVAIPMSM